MKRPLKIRGVGRCLPRRIVTNAELAGPLGMSAEQVFEQSGVRQRRRIDPSCENAASMGAQAAREALERAGMEAASLDLILNASATPLQALPDAAPFIQAELGLGQSGIACMSVSAACLSFLTALDVAASLLATARYRRILIVSSEVSSVGLDATDPETAPLFGDGAAAMVVTLPDENDPAAVDALHFETYGEAATLTQIPGCGTRRPPSAPTTRVEDSLFRMNGPALLKFAAKRARPFLKALRAQVLDTSLETALLVPHQPSRAGLRLFELLGFAQERMVLTLPELGNCVAASMPLGLYEAITSGRLREGERAWLMGTGAGVSFGGALLTY